jgi:hypothetical protein
VTGHLAITRLQRRPRLRALSPLDRSTFHILFASCPSLHTADTLGKKSLLVDGLCRALCGCSLYVYIHLALTADEREGTGCFLSSLPRVSSSPFHFVSRTPGGRSASQSIWSCFSCRCVDGNLS